MLRYIDMFKYVALFALVAIMYVEARPLGNDLLGQPLESEFLDKVKSGLKKAGT